LRQVVQVTAMYMPCKNFYTSIALHTISSFAELINNEASREVEE
jgi:hypothetical protein